MAGVRRSTPKATTFSIRRSSRSSEIRIDGEFVGLASRPFGWGKQFYSIERLGADDYRGLGDVILHGQGYMEESKRLYTLEQVADKAVELRLSLRYGISRMPTIPVLEKFLSDREARRKAEEAAASRRMKREDEERARVKAQAARDRADVQEALRGIAENHSAVLSNVEMNAIHEAIKAFAPIYEWNGRDDD